MTDTPPQVPIERQTARRLDAISVVWIVPLIALVVAAVIGWRAYVDRGPLIEIRFESASGVLEGQTELRFRDVPVGLVEDVQFTAGLAEVAVFVRVDQTVAPYIDENAQFWIVSPEVSAQGISGLDTVLSGVYIEGLWDDTLASGQTVFTGLRQPPLAAFEQGGLRIELRATGDTELTDQTPILFRGITVGQIGRARITRDGSAAFADAIIFEPYDQLIGSTTRFWDVSGIGFSIGAAGAEVNFGTVASILSGGITFGNLVSGGAPVRDGVVFQVYSDESAARASVFNASDGTPLQMTVIFEENVPGLAVGAPVELGGVRIGAVENLTGVVDPDRFGDQRVRLQTTLSIQPSRLGLPGEATPDSALAFLTEQVETGLRARLATASIFTGGLKIELVVVDTPDGAVLEGDRSPFPVFPSTESAVADLSASAEGVLTRVGNLPIEELMENAVVFLDTATALVGSEAIRAVPDEVLGLLEDARGLVGSDEAQSVPVALASALNEVETLLIELNERDAATRVLAGVAALEVAAQSISDAMTGVPDLISEVQAVAAKVEALPAEDLIVELTALTENANAVIGSEAARALPDGLASSLAALETLLDDLNTQDATGQLVATFAEIEAAATGFDEAIAGLPDLVARIDAVAAKAETVPLDDLAADLSDLLTSADALIDSEDARALPGALGSALDELAAVLTDLREGGATENLNETLASARVAADSIAASVEDLPQIVDRLSATLAQASATLASLDGGSDFNRDTRAALRAVQDAARDVSSLARAIERNPNSLITGR